jgi:hypothetical protein
MDILPRAMTVHCILLPRRSHIALDDDREHAAPASVVNGKDVTSHRMQSGVLRWSGIFATVLASASCVSVARVTHIEDELHGLQARELDARRLELDTRRLETEMSALRDRQLDAKRELGIALSHIDDTRKQLSAISSALTERATTDAKGRQELATQLDNLRSGLDALQKRLAGL